MRCPACAFDNLIGTEVCDNCGADLAGHDVPQPTTSFEGDLLGAQLDSLGVADPLIVSPATPVREAIVRMQETGMDCVLVVDDGRLVGIFTDRDAVMRTAGKRVDAAPVGDLMTHDPVVLRHDDPIAIAIHKMAVGGFRHIPLVENGRPTGVVSAREVFGHLARVLA